MAQNTITIQLCAEDRARLDRILAALENQPDHVAQPAQVPAEEPQPTEDTAPWEKPAEAKEVPNITHNVIQKKVVELSAAGKKAEVREVVMAYASKVSDIPEDKLAEVWKKLYALEA